MGWENQLHVEAIHSMTIWLIINFCKFVCLADLWDWPPCWQMKKTMSYCPGLCINTTFVLPDTTRNKQFCWEAIRSITIKSETIKVVQVQAYTLHDFCMYMYMYVSLGDIAEPLDLAQMFTDLVKLFLSTRQKSTWIHVRDKQSHKFIENNYIFAFNHFASVLKILCCASPQYYNVFSVKNLKIYLAINDFSCQRNYVRTPK